MKPPRRFFQRKTDGKHRAQFRVVLLRPWLPSSHKLTYFSLVARARPNEGLARLNTNGPVKGSPSRSLETRRFKNERCSSPAANLAQTNAVVRCPMSAFDPLRTFQQTCQA